jgi:hypothetical protein
MYVAHSYKHSIYDPKIIQHVHKPSHDFHVEPNCVYSSAYRSCGLHNDVLNSLCFFDPCEFCREVLNNTMRVRNSAIFNQQPNAYDSCYCLREFS